MDYLALIGDFIDSRTFTDRYQVQTLLAETLERLNDKYSQVIASQLTITLGDEFQGLFTLEVPIFKLIDEISIALSPYQIRFGIGLGKILTPINPVMSLGADGPAYWHARAAIEQLHAQNDYGLTKLAVRLDDANKSLQINTILAASEFIKSNWRASQADLLESLLAQDIYQEHFEKQLIASTMGLNKSAFSKRLKSSGIQIYFRLRAVAQAQLREGGH